MATGSSLQAEQRREQLLAMLAATGRLSMDEAAAHLGVSAMTIRRDLEALEIDRLVRRVRGGAVSVSRPRTYEDRAAAASTAKATIAQKALSLVPRTGIVSFDASSTVGTLLGLLDEDHAPLGMTNSQHNFGLLRRAPLVRPVLTGGEIEPETDSLVGPIAELATDAVRSSRFFSSAAALDEGWGSSEATLAEASMKRAFRRNTDSTILLVDASKLGRRADAHALSLDEIDTVVTELDPDHPRLAGLRDRVDLL